MPAGITKGLYVRGWYEEMNGLYHQYGKRILDIAGALCALVVALPLISVIALVICLTLGSPVLFRQVRPGLRCQPFVMYKFRTMTDERDNQGHLLPDEQRRTRLGAGQHIQCGAKRRDSRWKNAKTSDDLTAMKESEFLNILEHLSVIGKNVKLELQNQCLVNRNSCGHPNSLKIGENTVAAHIELLILYVY